MKTFTKTVVILLTTITTMSVFAQNNNSDKNIFASFPSNLPISKNLLVSTLEAKSGQIVAIPFNDKFIFSGKVRSNEFKSNNLQSMIVKSDAFPNTLFQLSKITENNNSKFVGRIINPDAVEAFVIKNDVADNYSLNKIEFKSILQDCSY
jgi:hypothetical protein